VPLPTLINPVFVSAVILVVYMLGTRRAGLPVHKNKDLAHIATAMDVLKLAESRLQPMGRLWEMLRDIQSLDGPLSPAPQPHQQPDSGDATAFTTRPPGFKYLTSTSSDIPSSSLSGLSHESSQAAQSFDFMDSKLYSDQTSAFETNMSIEQLLADGDPLDSMDGILDDELMSMWMTAPTDMANMAGDWNAYVENRGGDASCFSFGARQQ